MRASSRLLYLPLLLIACNRVASSDEAETDPTTTISETSGEPGEPETTDTEADSDSGTIIVESDAMVDPCDPWLQDCPEGDKCVPYASADGLPLDSSKCVPIAGDQGPGEPCVSGGPVEATDDCRADSICWNTVDIDGQLLGECAPLCTGSPLDPSCPEDRYCYLPANGAINVCLGFCDPLAQDCSGGLGCYWSGAEFTCFPAPDEGVEPGEPCAFINDCAPGLLCLASQFLPACADSACCAEFCSLDGGADECAAVPETTCVALFEEGFAPSGYEEVGTCVVMP
jgi:hypothetical protein